MVRRNRWDTLSNAAAVTTGRIIQEQATPAAAGQAEAPDEAAGEVVERTDTEKRLAEGALRHSVDPPGPAAA